jgi:flagellar assembly protein FliH
MNLDLPSAARAWRGVRVASTPVRLPATPHAAQAAADMPSDEDREARQRAFEQGAREGHEEGLRRGYEAGLRLGAAEAESSMQAIERAAAEALARVDAKGEALGALARALEDSRQAWIEAAEDDVVALCYEALCRIVGSEALRSDSIRPHVRHLLSQVRATPLAVHLHPDDNTLLQQQGVAQAGDAHPQWVADPEVALGGCIVRGTAGGLDLRLETALEACKTALLRARAERAQREAP